MVLPITLIKYAQQDVEPQNKKHHKFSKWNVKFSFRRKLYGNCDTSSALLLPQIGI
jgi:hypothetical protein